jgi:hypothetical protein
LRSSSAAALVDAIGAWIDTLFPDAQRAARLKQALSARFGDDPRPVTEELCGEIETVAHAFSRHFALEFVAQGTLTPDTDSPGWPPEDPVAVRARAASVSSVSRRTDAVGILALDALDPLDLAAPYLEAAFALLRCCSGLVLDLRGNGGGDPGTLALVLDWLLGREPTHISDVVYKDRTRQWWTTGRSGERALPTDTAVAVLISHRTFSSGEALAYHVQSQGRGPLVGQATRGAADHITPIRVTPHVRAFVPEAYVRDAVTGGNWEGAGVQPDVAADERAALEAAISLLR